MDASLAMRSMVPEHDGMVIACSGTSAAMLAKWHEEVRALKPNKRVRWHAKLWDKWRVAQRVRYVGKVRYVGCGDDQLPYEFEVYKQPDRAGGGNWWPVVDYMRLTALNAKPTSKTLSSFAQRMAESADPWATFHEIQAEPKAPVPEDPSVTAMRVLEATVNALPRGPRQHFEATFEELMCEGACESHATKQALASTTTAFPAEFLAASDAFGGLPPQLQCLTEFLEEEVFEEAARRRESRRAAKEENRRARAASEAAASSMAPGAPDTVAAQPPTAQQPAAQQPEMQTVADKEVQRANEAARERKRLMKKAAVQPSLTIPTAAADEAAGPGTPTEKTLSKNARRRREKKAKQQRAEQHRAEEKQQRADEEFCKVLKAVEPLRHESGTVVREDLECLESVKALESLLQKEEKQAKAKPRRARTQAETELAHALLGAGQLRGRMRQEVEAFVKGCPGIAPDAGAFAERLVEALLVGEAWGPHDLRAAAEVYGDFAAAFAAHSWIEPRLARSRRGLVLRAAAEA